MAGQTIPTAEISDIFFGKTPFVINTADAIKNYAEANTHDLEGYLKLASALSGFLSIPVGMVQLSSSLITSVHGDVKSVIIQSKRWVNYLQKLEAGLVL
jgi:hypothetical protein